MKHLKKFTESHLDWEIELKKSIEDLVQDIKDGGFEVIISDTTYFHHRKTGRHEKMCFKIRIKYEEPIIYHETDVYRFKQMNQKLKELMQLVEELLQRISNMSEFLLQSASLNGMNQEFLIVLKSKE